MSEAITRSTSSVRRTASDRRESIIVAARSLFARQGFHGTGMAQIAKESHVLVGQIYRDFASKEDLIAAIVERDVKELLDGPELAGAIEAGDALQVNVWVMGFITRKLDDETRSVLADVISEATRNPRIAAIVATVHERLRERLMSAAMLWASHTDKEAARSELVDLILAVAGAIQHLQLFGLDTKVGTMTKMVDMVKIEISKLVAAE